MAPAKMSLWPLPLMRLKSGLEEVEVVVNAESEFKKLLVFANLELLTQMKLNNLKDPQIIKIPK